MYGIGIVLVESRNRTLLDCRENWLLNGSPKQVYGGDTKRTETPPPYPIVVSQDLLPAALANK